MNDTIARAGADGRPLGVALVVLVAGALLGGCATKIYQGPTAGRSAESQQAVAMSVERALERFDPKPLAGRKVVIEAYGLTERLEGASPEEAYVRGALADKLLEAGAQVVDDREDAQVLLAATLKTVGCDVIRRDVPLIYHHTTFRGAAHLRLLTAALDGRAATRVLATTDAAAESVYRETYVFYLIGPIVTRYTEDAMPKRGP